MALTLTVDHLYEDLHVQPNTDNAQRVARYLAGAKPIVELFAPLAPDDVQDRAASMLIAYWWDQDQAGSEYGQRANAFVYCGARALLLPWRRSVARVIRSGR